MFKLLLLGIVTTIVPILVVIWILTKLMKKMKK